jgi:hypothetical protein
MPTFSDDNVTFIHIPKTAGSSITKWFQDNTTCAKNNYGHIFLSEIDNPASLIFAVVRNPWDRIVSIYSFVNDNYECCTCNFENFIYNMIKTVAFDGKKFSTPQIRWIEPGVTHILRFENLEKDFKIIQDIFQCYEPLPLENKTKHEHYRTYYNDETRQLVAEMFKEDIEAFGYEF